MHLRGKIVSRMDSSSAQGGVLTLATYVTLEEATD